jgi:hypothetical protein
MGETALTLSTEEAQALKDKLEELRAQDPCSRIFDAILKQIRFGRGKDGLTQGYAALPQSLASLRVNWTTRSACASLTKPLCDELIHDGPDTYSGGARHGQRPKPQGDARAIPEVLETLSLESNEWRPVSKLSSASR